MSGDTEAIESLVAALRKYVDPALDELHRRIDQIAAARDGRDGRDGKDGAPGAAGADGKNGADGSDGLGFDDLSVEHDGERALTLRFLRGERVREFPLTLPLVLDRGVYKAGTSYERGDGVTWGGSFWIAQEATGERPEGGKGWRLAVKRGRDGKDGAK